VGHRSNQALPLDIEHQPIVGVHRIGSGRYAAAIAALDPADMFLICWC
jgi:hypothetical protein